MGQKASKRDVRGLFLYKYLTSLMIYFRGRINDGQSRMGVIYNILKQNFNTEHVTLLHTSKISFQFDSQVQWTCDGENGGTYSYVEVKNYHKAIGIFV